MKLGLFGMPIHPADVSLAEAYESDANRIILADELGYAEAFIGEHQTCATEPVASPLMLMASVIHRTKNITLGSGVTALPMYHPAMAAATVAQFDNMARGRFIWGVGQGGLASDWEAFGVMDGQERNERMIESVSIIKELWTGTAPFHFTGKHYPFSIDETVNAELSIGQPIKPFQRPTPADRRDRDVSGIEQREAGHCAGLDPDVGQLRPPVHRSLPLGQDRRRLRRARRGAHR